MEFPRLYPDLDDKGGNVLWVVRRSGQMVEISELSEGTVDQLYLALRLASLEHYDEIEQTMPLVMDDVFMTFDDERSAAALRVLDKMSDRFQVVLFTHHFHLTELTVRALPSERAHVHELPRYTPQAQGKANETLPEAPSDKGPQGRGPVGSGNGSVEAVADRSPTPGVGTLRPAARIVGDDGTPCPERSLRRGPDQGFEPPGRLDPGGVPPPLRHGHHRCAPDLGYSVRGH